MAQLYTLHGDRAPSDASDTDCSLDTEHAAEAVIQKVTYRIMQGSELNELQEQLQVILRRENFLSDDAVLHWANSVRQQLTGIPDLHLLAPHFNMDGWSVRDAITAIRGDLRNFQDNPAVFATLVFIASGRESWPDDPVICV